MPGINLGLETLSVNKNNWRFIPVVKMITKVKKKIIKMDRRAIGSKKLDLSN